MSVTVMGLVWNDQRVQSQSQLLVLLALADHANDAHVCYPSVLTISKKARISERQTQRVLRDLVTAGMLYVKEGRGRGRHTRYLIAIGMSRDDFEAALTHFDDLTDAERNAWLEKFGKGDAIVSPIPSKGVTMSPKRARQEKVKKVTSETEKVTFETRKGDILEPPKSPVSVVTVVVNEPCKDADPSLEPSEEPSYIQNSLSLVLTAQPEKVTELAPPPDGYETLWSYKFTDEQGYSHHLRHFRAPGRVTCMCGKTAHTIGARGPGWTRHDEVDEQCGKCQRALEERQAHKVKPKRAPKPPNPAIYSDKALFDAIGAFSFGAKDAADLRAVAGRVGKIRAALADYVCEKNGGAPDAERVAEVVARVKELPDFYRVECKDCTPPATPDTFMTWYTKMLAKRGGNGNGTGVRYVWRGKEWPVYEGRVHVEIMPNVHRNIPASAAYWQSFLEEMDREEKHNAAVARK